MNTAINFAEASGRISKITADILATLDANQSYHPVSAAIRQDLQKKERDACLRIVFVGQYSAGKSTIISALTGNNNIKIDADIATSETTQYPWNGVLLTDTPGLYTERKDHDSITEDMIKHADILVYVLTFSLFDDVLIENFKRLAYDRGYASKMMLVVNKMYSEEGEYDQLVANYTLSLRKQLEGHDLDRFPISFIAAQYARESDPAFHEYSHIDALINNINGMISGSGMLHRLSTSAHIVIDHVQNSVAQAGDASDQDYLKLILRVERIFSRAEREANVFIAEKTTSLRANIASLGAECAGSLGIDKDIEGVIKKASDQADVLAQKTYQEIGDFFEKRTPDIQAEIAELGNSELAHKVLASFSGGDGGAGQQNIGGRTVQEKANFDKLLKINQLLRAGSGQIANMSAGANAGTGLLSASGAAGSQMHQLVFTVGKWAGVKFQPWQAVNLAKDIGNVARVAGPLLAALPIFVEIYDIHAESKYEEQITDARRQLRSRFVDHADTVVSEIRKESGKYVKEVYTDTLEILGKLKSDMIAESVRLDESAKRLVGLVAEMKQVVDAL